MDRRYRGSFGYNRGVSPYREKEPVCGDVAGRYTFDDDCEREPDYFEDAFDRDRERFPLGMCYVPWQRFENLYENEFVALKNGTLFKDLDYDWYGRGCK